ncbi:hypothetical protein F511_32277 [Dorcoceras hygrometricum]|uniref:Retrotransposon gag domain-containing protein n=1 Tax=Dorcoceras hygrometricum TaxID=472368 RepID=A0A2Z7CFL1_9LAMI|nr:hypothetical protein F511_32277 [Dorcoceras hygrometricum]
METLDWVGSKKLFYDKYFTPDVQAKLKREFTNLQHGDMTVAEYVKKFDRGCRFSPLIVNDPAKKFQHFLDGLSPTIHRDVLIADPTDYATTLKRAFSSEKMLKDIRTNGEARCIWETIKSAGSKAWDPSGETHLPNLRMPALNTKSRIEGPIREHHVLITVTHEKSAARVCKHLLVEDIVSAG